jgi:hypothetical protein
MFGTGPAKIPTWVHDSSPYRKVDAKCLTMDCLLKLTSRRGQIRAASFSENVTLASEPDFYGKHEKISVVNRSIRYGWDIGCRGTGQFGHEASIEKQESCI